MYFVYLTQILFHLLSIDTFITKRRHYKIINYDNDAFFKIPEFFRVYFFSYTLLHEYFVL